MKQAIQIGHNVSDIMNLDCVTRCEKTLSGNLRYKGTFRSRKGYAAESDWLVCLEDGDWVSMSNSEYYRIKNRL